MKKEANSVPLIAGEVRIFCNIVLLGCLIFGSLYVYYNYTEINIELVSKVALTSFLVFALLWCILFYLISQKKISKDGIFFKVIYLSFGKLLCHDKHIDKYKESSKLNINFCDIHTIIFFLPIFVNFLLAYSFILILISILTHAFIYVLSVSYNLLLGHKIYDLGYRGFLNFISLDYFEIPIEEDKYTKDLKILNFTLRLRPMYALLPLWLYMSISFIGLTLELTFTILLVLTVTACICLLLWGLHTILKKQCLTYSVD